MYNKLHTEVPTVHMYNKLHTEVPTVHMYNKLHTEVRGANYFGGTVAVPIFVGLSLQRVLGH